MASESYATVEDSAGWKDFVALLDEHEVEERFFQLVLKRLSRIGGSDKKATVNDFRVKDVTAIKKASAAAIKSLSGARRIVAFSPNVWCRTGDDQRQGAAAPADSHEVLSHQ